MNFFRYVFVFSVKINQTNAYDVKLYDKIGVAIENLKDSVTVTNGFVTTQMSIELSLPTIDTNETVDNCAAAANAHFVKHADAALLKFRAQMKAELAEFVDDNPLNEDVMKPEQEEEDETITVEKVKSNILLCSKPNVACKFLPIVDLNPGGSSRTIPSTQYRLRPCYSSSLGNSEGLCKLNSGTGICCSKVQSKNSGYCPGEYLDQSLSIINRHEAFFPDRTHDLGYGQTAMKNVGISRIQNYCVGLLSVTIDGVKTIVGTYTDLPGKPKIPVNRKRREVKEKHRSKRSNWSYYAQGGFLTSSYIDGQIQEVKNIMDADSNALRQAVKKNSRVLLTLQADKKEHDQLKAAICSSTERLSESLFMSELRNTQAQLEFKSEMILRSCATNIVPDQIETSILTRLCRAKSDSHKCYGKVVRSLFSCALTKPLITTTKVGITFILTMQVPINEMYKAYRIHSIGVAFKNNAIDIQMNYTEPKAVQETDEKQRIGQEDLQLALRNLLLGNGTRHKREILNTFHYLRLRDLPNIAIEFNGDLISFKESKCKKTPFGLLVDYSQNAASDSECIKAIFHSIVPKISHYCKIALESSNYNCIVKNMGVNGYLISTSATIDIQDISAGVKSVFNNQVGEKCQHNVCVVTVSKYEKKFHCGNRAYTVGAQPDEVVKVKSQKLEKVQLQGFTAQKGETSDLLLSGFDLLDAAPISRKLLTRASTFSIVFSVLACFSIGLIITKYLCRRIIRVPFYITRWLICLPRDCLNWFNTQTTNDNSWLHQKGSKTGQNRAFTIKKDEKWKDNDSLRDF